MRIYDFTVTSANIVKKNYIAVYITLSGKKKCLLTATFSWGHSSNMKEMGTDEFITKILPLKDNLLRVAFRITGDAKRSEQIVQDVMLKVWSQRAVWVVIEDIPSYCLMVTRNMALQTNNLYQKQTESFTVR